MGRISRALLTSILVLAAVAPAAQAQGCVAGDAGPRYEALGLDDLDGSASGVRLCDRRRGAVRNLHRGDVGGISILGDRVAWGETRGGRGRIVVADIRTRRVLLRRSVGRAWRFGVEPALLRDGDLAWLARTRPNGPGRLVLARSGARPRTLQRGYVAALASEDGVTLRWKVGEQIRYRDVSPLPVRGGCPRRQRFRPVVETEEMLVSIADYEAPETEDIDLFTVIRACVRATREDPVVLGRDTTIYGSAYGAVAARAGWVVLSDSGPVARDGSGTSTTKLRAVHVDGRRGRALTLGSGPNTSRRSAFAVTDAGVPALIQGDRVLSVDAAARQVELDRGDVANLGAQGDTITWTNAGALRSASP